MRLSFDFMKQERRGGIETVGIEPTSSGSKPSRNAVVALKPAKAVMPTTKDGPKQERRGGIETPHQSVYGV